jgi:hypothetical protein
MLVVVYSARGNIEDTVLQVVVLVQQLLLLKETALFQAARRRLRVVECDDAVHHVEYPMIQRWHTCITNCMQHQNKQKLHDTKERGI